MASVNPSRVYEDYDPPSDLVTEDGSDTILIYLPGYRKEQLRVQLTTSRILKISGERQIDGNKWRRFNKEFRVPSNCDAKQITAKYEGGILYIRQPKLTTTAAQEVAKQPAKGKTSAARPSPQQQAPDLPQRQPQQAPDLPPHQPQQVPDLPPPQSQQVPDSPQPQAELHPPVHSDSQPLPLPLLKAPLPEPQGGLEGRKDSHKDAVRKEKADEGKDKSEFKARPPRADGRGGLYNELRKSDNFKRLVVSVLLVLGIGFYIIYMFNTFLGDSGYDKEL